VIHHSQYPIGTLLKQNLGSEHQYLIIIVDFFPVVFKQNSQSSTICHYSLAFFRDKWYMGKIAVEENEFAELINVGELEVLSIGASNEL
jgi:hypothetical protein